MSFVVGFCRYALPILAFIILFKCLLTLLIGHPVNKTYGYIIKKQSGEKIPLNTWETSIGRSKSCDIVLNDTQVSRFHAVICRRVDGWYIFDTVSKGGTFVNGKKITKGVTINHSDSIAFADVEYYFAVVDDPVIPVGKKRGRKTQDESISQKGQEFIPASQTRPKSFEEKTFSSDSLFDDDFGNLNLNFTQKTDYSDFSSFNSNEDVFSGNKNKKASYIPKKSSEKHQSALKSLDGGFIYLLCGNNVTLGRGRGMDIKLSDIEVSRAHAVLTNKNGKWFIDDTASTCGTFVSGKKVLSPTELFDGDILLIGRKKFEFIENYKGHL